MLQIGYTLYILITKIKLTINKSLSLELRTPSQLLALREAARMVPDCAQPIILAYGTCASAKNSRHSAGAWLNEHCAKIKSNVD